MINAKPPEKRSTAMQMWRYHVSILTHCILIAENQKKSRNNLGKCQMAINSAGPNSALMARKKWHGVCGKSLSVSCAHRTGVTDQSAFVHSTILKKSEGRWNEWTCSNNTKTKNEKNWTIPKKNKLVNKKIQHKQKMFEHKNPRKWYKFRMYSKPWCGQRSMID